ncbi:chalcone isomerase family protein [Kiloniella majae]|uniref:chalcone isomerase family protein n=1 Tax=Kiloniella majae TaxID=1938558 RepID=UPI001C3F9470|nr:chalcone isomerase family protein [Kiloniella majae]
MRKRYIAPRFLSRHLSLAICLTLSLVLASHIAMSSPAAGNDLVAQHVPSAQAVGKGRLSILFWDVYDAELLAPNGQWNAEKPFALSLTYLRDIDGRDIADKSAEEIRSLGFDDEVKLAAWHNQMLNIFPDVKEGTNLTGIYAGNGESIFFHKNKEIGRISDPDFGHYFFDIWLNTKTSAPQLRAKLLGQS